MNGLEDNALAHPAPHKSPSAGIGLLLASAIAAILGLALFDFSWLADDLLHTVLESIATSLALVVGCLAFVRFYSRRGNQFLFFSLGFVGTALFDGFHVLITSPLFAESTTSAMSELAPWSWLLSRTYLGLFMVLGAVTSWNDERPGGPIYPFRLVLISTLTALACFAIFVYAPLPDVVYSDMLIHRPLEVVPAILFLLALFVYYRAGRWRDESLFNWLLYSLVLNIAVQLAFMVWSHTLYDASFNFAHIGKIVAYSLVFIGLARSLQGLVLSYASAAADLRSANRDLQAEIVQRETAERSVRMYQEIVDNMSSGVTVYHLEEWDDLGSFRVIMANQAASRIAGIPTEDFLHKTIRETVPSSLETDFPLMYRNVLETQQPLAIDELYFSGDGIEGFFQVWAFPLDDRRLGTVFNDISDRMLAAEELRASRARLTQAQRLAHLGHWDWNLHTHAVKLSAELAEILGFAGGAQQIRFSDFVERIHPQDRKRIEESIYTAIDEQQLFDLEFRVAPPEGDERVVHAIGQITEYREGKPVQLGGTGQDVTDRYLTDQKLKHYNRKLEASNRELEDFAYIASHDLQEPLRKIVAFGGRIQKMELVATGDTGANQKFNDYLDRMLNAAQRMQALINDLLNLSRVTTRGQPFEQVNLKQIVHEVLSDLETAIAESSAHVAVEDLPTIEADPLQMRQLFQNLISNSIKFRQDDQPLQISIHALPAENAEDDVRVVVQDTGIGFDQKYQAKIFEPFQRLHGRQAYVGTGIGLAIVRKIVERHHGVIGAESQPGVGTKVNITLPRMHEQRAVNGAVTSLQSSENIQASGNIQSSGNIQTSENIQKGADA